MGNVVCRLPKYAYLMLALAGVSISGCQSVTNGLSNWQPNAVLYAQSSYHGNDGAST
ncbi:hypothetical protein [Faucicola atlantae]|uniref:hypothetical protein n=1 Tax=Faucicola atlantae TaxID=34059 RepID=UPI0025B0AA38|nr:hypothetical protein [Moraxella atlantae]